MKDVITDPESLDNTISLGSIPTQDVKNLLDAIYIEEASYANNLVKEFREKWGL